MDYLTVKHNDGVGYRVWWSFSFGLTEKGRGWINTECARDCYLRTLVYCVGFGLKPFLQMKKKIQSRLTKSDSVLLVTIFGRHVRSSVNWLMWDFSYRGLRVRETLKRCCMYCTIVAYFTNILLAAISKAIL